MEFTSTICLFDFLAPPVMYIALGMVVGLRLNRQPISAILSVYSSHLDRNVFCRDVNDNVYDN